MRKISALFILILATVLFDACKKEPKTPPDDNGGGGGEYTTTDVKVMLPTGSNMDLSQTRIWTMTRSNSVGSNGNAKVPFITNGCELAFLFDASDNLLLMGYIYEGNKELSVKSTALALLYHGLGLSVFPDSTRQLFLAKNVSNPKLTDYYSKIEQAFKSDVQMLEKRSFMAALNEAVSMITNIKPIDIYTKQLDVVDDDKRSQIQIEKIDDDNVKINNTSYRRAHAFVYKTAFKDLNNKETVLLNNIDYDDEATKDLPVAKVKYVKNALDMYAQYYTHNPAVTEPIGLPIAASEKEAYKLRVIGPGKPGATLTDAEKAELDELYNEYLAFDILAPFLAEAVGVRSNYTINEDNLSAYLQKVKAIAQLDPEIMERLKGGNSYNNIPRMFFDAMDNGGQSRVNLINSFLDGFRTQFPSRQLPTQQQVTDAEKLVNKGLDLLEYLTGTTSSKFVLAGHDYFNTMEEFTVKAKDNDVKISPRKSDVMAFTNHPLTVTANPSLSSGESLEYDWTTTGSFGVLKNGSSEGTSFTTTAKTINYYGKSTPQETNIERVVVTAYIKNSGGARTKYGSDTATINVKKVKIVMRPEGAELSPIHGYKSVKMYLTNSDGTNPIINSAAVQYKVEWSTSGSYGHFAGGVQQSTTSVNNITYIATDEDVKEATENITARIYFKLASTDWMLREEVKGSVKISNDEKKLVFYVAPQAVHRHSVNACGVGCVFIIKPIPNAISYSVQITGVSNNAPYTDSWKPGDNNHVRHYAYPLFAEAEAGEDYIIGFNASWSGGGPGTPVDEHFQTPNCTGMAKVTVTVSQ